MSIDLNADLGEGVGDDAALMQIVTSASIACGGHAGDEISMADAVRLAVANNVRIGAHPSYEDRENFGRTYRDVAAAILTDQLTDQVQRLARIAEDGGGHVAYLKPHGALYNTAMASHEVAHVVVDVAATALDAPLPVMCLPASKVAIRAAELGLPVITEGFADRALRPDGSLVPRSEPGAVLGDADRVADQVRVLALRVDSICVHGDTPGAVELARVVAATLTELPGESE